MHGVLPRQQKALRQTPFQAPSKASYVDGQCQQATRSAVIDEWNTQRLGVGWTSGASRLPTISQMCSFGLSLFQSISAAPFLFVPDLRPSRNRVFSSQLCASWLDLAEKRAGMVRDWWDVEQNLFQTWPLCLTVALVFQRIDQFLHLCVCYAALYLFKTSSRSKTLLIQSVGPSDPPCGHGSKVGRRPYTTGYLSIRLANPWMKAHDLAIWTCLRQVEQWKRRFPEMWLANGTTIFWVKLTWPSDGCRFDKIMLMFFFF